MGHLVGQRAQHEQRLPAPAVRGVAEVVQEHVIPRGAVVGRARAALHQRRRQRGLAGAAWALYPQQRAAPRGVPLPLPLAPPLARLAAAAVQRHPAVNLLQRSGSLIMAETR